MSLEQPPLSSAGGVTLGERIIEAFLAFSILALLSIAAYASLVRATSCIYVTRVAPRMPVEDVKTIEVKVRNVCTKPVRIEKVEVIGERDNIVFSKSLGVNLAPGHFTILRIEVNAGEDGPISLLITYSVVGEGQGEARVALR